MKIQIAIHEAVVYRWVGVFEGILSVLLTVRYGWPVALVIFILIRFVDTQVLSIVMAALAKAAASSANKGL